MGTWLDFIWELGELLFGKLANMDLFCPYPIIV